MSSPVVLIDEPAPHVRRIALNRPEKRNALDHALRGGIIRALQEADEAPDIRVMIVRGAGKCFSAGYDLGGGNAGQQLPRPGGSAAKKLESEAKPDISTLEKTGHLLFGPTGA